MSFLGNLGHWVLRLSAQGIQSINRKTLHSGSHPPLGSESGRTGNDGTSVVSPPDPSPPASWAACVISPGVPNRDVLFPVLKECHLWIYLMGFRSPDFPETNREDMETWTNQHLVRSWSALSRRLGIPPPPVNPADADDPSVAAPTFPMWYILPRGHRYLDKAMGEYLQEMPRVHRLAIMLSTNPHRKFVERVGRYLSDTDVYPVLLSGPEALIQMVSHGDYFIPSCLEITFLLDEASRTAERVTMLNLIRYRLRQATNHSIPVTLELLGPELSSQPGLTPVVERPAVVQQVSSSPGSSGGLSPWVQWVLDENRKTYGTPVSGTDGSNHSSSPSGPPGSPRPFPLRPGPEFNR